MNRKPRQIQDLVIDEISLVDKGANQHASVTIAKSADGDKESYMEIYDEQGNQLDPDALDLGDVVFDADGQAYEVSDETEDESFEEEEREPELVGKRAAGMGDPFRRMGQNLGIGKTGARYAQKNPAKVSRNRKIAAGAGVGAVGAGGAAGYVQKNYGETLREELSKALTDYDRDEIIAKAFSQLDELSEAAEIAKAAAEQEREIRLTREYVEVAKSYSLPVDEDALGVALMHCAEVLPMEDQEVIAKALAFAAEANQALFQEYGAVGGGDNADVYEMVDAYVDENVSKSGKTREELMAEAFAANPAAYDEYLAGY